MKFKTYNSGDADQIAIRKYNERLILAIFSKYQVQDQLPLNVKRNFTENPHTKEEREHIFKRLVNKDGEIWLETLIPDYQPHTTFLNRIKAEEYSHLDDRFQEWLTEVLAPYKIDAEEITAYGEADEMGFYVKEDYTGEENSLHRISTFFFTHAHKFQGLYPGGNPELEIFHGEFLRLPLNNRGFTFLLYHLTEEEYYQELTPTEYIDDMDHHNFEIHSQQGMSELADLNGDELQYLWDTIKETYPELVEAEEMGFYVKESNRRGRHDPMLSDVNLLEAFIKSKGQRGDSSSQENDILYLQPPIIIGVSPQYKISAVIIHSYLLGCEHAIRFQNLTDSSFGTKQVRTVSYLTCGKWFLQELLQELKPRYPDVAEAEEMGFFLQEQRTLTHLKLYETFTTENATMVKEITIEKGIPGKYFYTYSPVQMSHILGRILYNLGLDTDTVQYLGAGCYGYAFRVGDKVVKITEDEAEYRNANRVRRKATHYIVNYYDARPLHLDGDQEYYVLLMDYVDNYDDQPLRRRMSALIKLYNLYFGEHDKTDLTVAEVLSHPEIDEVGLHHLLNIYGDEERAELSEPYLVTWLNKIHHIRLEADKYGIPFSDCHGGNVGLDEEGELRWYDLGVEANKYKSQPLKSHVVTTDATSSPPKGVNWWLSGD